MKIITVGLTGGIGSGKTFISSIFQAMNVPVYDSDSNAKRLMTSSLNLIDRIKDLFGDAAYKNDGELNRAYLGSKIFHDQELRTKLNGIVHPAVRKDFQEWSKIQDNPPFVINEAALFVENGSYKDFDFLISVISPPELRINRIRERNKINRAEIVIRMQSQSSDDEKIKKSDFIIYNDSTQSLYFQISQIHKIITTKMQNG